MRPSTLWHIVKTISTPVHLLGEYYHTPMCSFWYNVTVLFSGMGSGMSIIPALTATSRLFSERYIATVIGGITTGGNVGPLFYTLCYNTWFLGDGSYDGQDIRGYFLFVPISQCVTHALGLLTFGLTLWEENELSEDTRLIKHNNKKKADSEIHTIHLNEMKTTCAEDEMQESMKNTSTAMSPAVKMTLSSSFQLNMWVGGILLTLKYIGINNLNAILLSLGLQKYEVHLPYLSPVTSLILKTPVGLVADYTRDKFSRAWYYIISSVLMIIFFIMAAYASNNIYVISFSLVCWSLGSDTALTVQPAIHTDDFGKAYFSINSGMFLGLWAMMCFVAQIAFSVSYGANINTDAGVCYGLQCYNQLFWICAGIAAICILLTALYLYLLSRRLFMIDR